MSLCVCVLSVYSVIGVKVTGHPAVSQASVVLLYQTPLAACSPTVLDDRNPKVAGLSLRPGLRTVRTSSFSHELCKTAHRVDFVAFTSPQFISPYELFSGRLLISTQCISQIICLSINREISRKIHIEKLCAPAARLLNGRY